MDEARLAALGGGGNMDEWQGSLAAMIANTERNLSSFTNSNGAVSHFGGNMAITGFDKVRFHKFPG